ncbi:MAG: 4Fe-4S dicluster domain-containing protein [Deltaproteobacteria bacterium]|nr:4Fe-4S dicluster domain-containing protein [Deltaproteobacteria bacterium]
METSHTEIGGEALKPGFALAARLREAHLAVDACYQCKKCSSGCPLTFAMDLLPDQVIRLALLGQEDLVLRATTPWVCSSCETCTTRCPNGIDIAGVMDWLKEEALRRGYAVPQEQVSRFHQSFLEAVRLGGGRLSEPLLLGLYSIKSGKTLEKLKSGELKEEILLGWELARRGRLRLRPPKRLKGAPEIARMFQAAQERP